jgi:hypothetical protein
MMIRSSRGKQMISRARGASSALRRTGTANEPEPVKLPAQDGAPLHADPELDTATYTCSCGLVFEAPVSTTVGCPHCGGRQAW